MSLKPAPGSSASVDCCAFCLFLPQWLRKQLSRDPGHTTCPPVDGSSQMPTALGTDCTPMGSNLHPHAAPAPPPRPLLRTIPPTLGLRHIQLWGDQNGTHSPTKYPQLSCHSGHLLRLPFHSPDPGGENRRPSLRSLGTFQAPLKGPGCFQVLLESFQASPGGLQGPKKHKTSLDFKPFSRLLFSPQARAPVDPRAWRAASSHSALLVSLKVISGT